MKKPAGKYIDVESKRSDRFLEGIVEKEHEENRDEEEKTPRFRNHQPGEEAPHLAFENLGLVKTDQGGIGWREDREKKSHQLKSRDPTQDRGKGQFPELFFQTDEESITESHTAIVCEQSAFFSIGHFLFDRHSFRDKMAP